MGMLPFLPSLDSFRRCIQFTSPSIQSNAAISFIDFDPNLSKRSFPLFIVMDSITDSNNVGSILRTSLFFGVEGVIVTEDVLLSPLVSRISVGAMEICKILVTKSLLKLLHSARNNGWKVLGTGIPNSDRGSLNSKDSGWLSITPQTPLILEAPTILVLGNESVGIRDSVLNLCHNLLHLPGAPTVSNHSKSISVDSLNVGVSVGIILSSIL